MLANFLRKMFLASQVKMNDVEDNMNDVEKEILRHFHDLLTTTIIVGLEEFVLKLYSRKIINETFLKELLKKKDPKLKVAEISNLLILIPSFCSMKEFLECLHSTGYEFLSTEIKKKLTEKLQGGRQQSTRNWVQPYTSTQNTTFVDNFAEKLKIKIHNSEARKFESCIRLWIKRLLSSDCHLSLSESRQRADCCFILLDSIAVMERTHSSHRDLWRSPVYSQMESLIAKTSNPLLSRVRHDARYGVALFLGGKDQDGLEYIEAALNDAKTPGGVSSYTLVYTDVPLVWVAFLTSQIYQWGAIFINLLYQWVDKFTSMDGKLYSLEFNLL